MHLVAGIEVADDSDERIHGRDFTRWPNGGTFLTHRLRSLPIMAHVITIADYDPSWPDVFDLEHATLVAACCALPLAVEHIGSTSVPDLGAKPIVDILLGLDPGAELNACIKPITGLGYEYVAEYEHGPNGMPFRRYFKSGGPSPMDRSTCTSCIAKAASGTAT